MVGRLVSYVVRKVVSSKGSDSVLYVLPRTCKEILCWVYSPVFPFLYKVECDGLLRYEEELKLVGGIPKIGVFKDSCVLGRVLKVYLYNNAEREAVSFLSFVVKTQ